MRFLYPGLFLGWALLALVPVVLYLFRPRPRTVRTSTLPFFKWLAREHQDSTWLKWLKHLLSLLLSILVILATAAALGRLVVAPSAESLKTVVVLVDRSASMAARHGGGPTRLDEAKRLANERLAGLSAGVGVVVMAYDRRPEVLLSRSMDRRQVLRAIDSIELRPIPGDARDALRLARRLAALETPAGIWHVTDTSAPDRGPAGNTLSDEKAAAEDAAKQEEGQSSDGPPVAVKHLAVALEQPVNVGITAVELRRLPLARARFEAFVQVQCAASEPVDATLEIRLDNSLVAIRNLTLPPGGKEKLLIPVDAGEDADRVLSLRLSAEGDVLPLDNVVYTRVPRLRPVKVLWISESPDPFTELALSTLGSDRDIEVLQGAPGAWPPEEPVDVAIFDGWFPKQWPEDVSVIVVNPPGSLGPVRAVALENGGLPLDVLRATDEGHPLLYGVATDRIAVTQTAVVQSGGPLEPVWVGTSGPVLLAGEAHGQRVAVLALSPQHSEQLPLMSSYPLLIGNAIYWAAEGGIESARGKNLRTGEMIKLEGDTLTWLQPEKGPAGKTVSLSGRAVELDQIGLWETGSGETGSASLLSPRETLLPAAPEQSENKIAAAGETSWLRGDLVPLLLWSVLGLLLAESWLFHRYLAY